MTFELRMEHWRGVFADALASCLAERYQGDEVELQAIRYALGVGGKRVRPVLCLLATEALDGQPKAALPAALALEFIHTYSLAHDDLPCMDDDDLRRGKPTLHKVYGEAQALLGGDALLTDAFALLCEDGPAGAELSERQRLLMVRELAHAAGGSGMVLGQSLDLHWTARQGAKREDLDRIHLLKTGRLLGASAALGAIAAGAGPEIVARFRSFGEQLGLAFQILDDVLDDSASTGKSAGKDKDAGKLTYLSMMRPEAARSAAEAHSSAALAHLGQTGARVDELSAFVRWLLQRTF